MSATTAGSSGRILLARFHSLGDVILSTGLAVRLRDRGQTVEVATDLRFVPVYEGLPVARIWTREEISGAGTFDAVLDLQGNASSRRLLRGRGPLRRPHGRSLARRWMVLWGDRPPRGQIPHAVQRYAETAGLEGLDVAELRPRLSVTDRDVDEARRLPRSWAATGETCVGVVVGASRRMKQWPAAHFASLCAALRGQGLNTLRFVEPAALAHEEEGLVHAPLRSLKALVGRCATVVTNDSGVMHLAVGLGVPVVSIFGSTTPGFGFRPLGEHDRVLQRDLACRPCAVHGARFCWQLHERCLRGITVEEVLESVLLTIDPAWIGPNRKEEEA